MMQHKVVPGRELLLYVLAVASSDFMVVRREIWSPREKVVRTGIIHDSMESSSNIAPNHSCSSP
jgi:hypothetical protein